MFSTIKNYWREARGTVLKKEVVDALDKLFQLHEGVQALSLITFLDALRTVEQECGLINNLSNKRRLTLAKRFHTAGRQAFDSNVGGAYGLFLMSAYLEASALPGEDAKQALSLVADCHGRAQAIQNAALREKLPDERQQNTFPYTDYESWYRVYKEAFRKTKPSIEPFLDFMDDEPLRRAFRDRVDPEGLGQAFAENFDPAKWGLPSD